MRYISSVLVHKLNPSNRFLVMIYPLSNSRLVLVCWTAGIKSERDTGDRVSFNDFFKHRERAIVLAGTKEAFKKTTTTVLCGFVLLADP